MITRILSGSAAFLAACALMSSVALADPLSDAKAAGLVGEKPDGYLGVVSANAAAQQLVADINARRKAEYKNIAARNGQSLSVVEALVAAKLAAKAQPGEYVMTQSGQWVKK